MNVLITGTSQGIGKATASLFLSKGHNVYGFDVLPQPFNDVNYHHYTLDVRDVNNFPSLPDINVIINNAGIQESLQAGDVIDINLKGTLNVTEYYGIHPCIKSIIMIGSASAHTGAEFPEYSASKSGLLAYVKNVAQRIAEFGGTCNSVDAGGVLTDLNKPVIEDKKLWKKIMDVTPLRRWATADEIAQWVYFLSLEQSFCTGQNIVIDGGESINSTFVWPK